MNMPAVLNEIYALIDKAFKENNYDYIREAFKLALDFNSEHEDEEIFMAEDDEYVMVGDDMFYFEGRF